MNPNNPKPAVIMEAMDEVVRLEKLLDTCCVIIQSLDKMRTSPPSVRDYWGKRRAKLKRESDAKTPVEKWRD